MRADQGPTAAHQNSARYHRQPPASQQGGSSAPASGLLRTPSLLSSLNQRAGFAVRLTCCFSRSAASSGLPRSATESYLAFRKQKGCSHDEHQWHDSTQQRWCIYVQQQRTEPQQLLAGHATLASKQAAAQLEVEREEAFTTLSLISIAGVATSTNTLQLDRSSRQKTHLEEEGEDTLTNTFSSTLKGLR